MAKIIGIDLGTTNSLVATVRSGTPETLPDGRDYASDLAQAVRRGPAGDAERVDGV
mgnify:CR=1 FL=1